MPKKPRKQHVTHYMDPNPWENPKGVKKPKKVKKSLVEVSAPELSPKTHWKSYKSEVVAITNTSVALDYYTIVEETLEIAFHNVQKREITKTLNTQIEYQQTKLGSAQSTINSLYNELYSARQEITSLHQQMNAKQAQLGSAQSTINSLYNELYSARQEITSLHQQMNAKQAQFERIASIAITENAPARHFREEE